MNSPTHARSGIAPPSLWLTSVIAAGLQLAGVYAAIVTFGVLLTVAIYVAGAGVTFLQQVIVRRIP